jgi:hypothetical protein
MEAIMFMDTAQALLLLAIVGLTLLSAIDLTLQPTRPQKDTDQKR